MIQLPTLPRWTLALAFAMTLGTCAVPGVAVAAPDSTTRVSVSTSGVEGEGGSQSPSISKDGMRVAFVSDASDLPGADAIGTLQVYVRDRKASTTTLVSVRAGGTAGGNQSSPFAPSISADGRYVVFESSASDLVVGDTNGTSDIFVRDLTNRTTMRVSPSGALASGGSHAPSISATGGVVAFAVANDTAVSRDVYVWDHGTTTLVSATPSGAPGRGWSDAPSVSGDGRFVAFSSEAADLLPVGDDTNARGDVFVRELSMGITTRVSVSGSGTEGSGESAFPSISENGAVVSFVSDAPDLVAGDDNGTWDVFVRNRVTGTTTRASVGPTGVEGNDAVADQSPPSISPDARYVAFESLASNLVPSDTNGESDIFVRDITAGTTKRVSMRPAGAQATYPSHAPSISGSGPFVAFDSEDPGIVTGDTNELTDVFVAVVTPVSTSLSLKVTGTVRYGKYVTLTGTLKGGVPIGSLVRYQVRLPHKSSYATISSPRKVSASGVSSLRYKLAKRGTYYFRAVFPDVPGFASSTSKTVKVVVK